MAEPEDHTLRVLRELRAGMQALNDKIDRNHADLTARIEAMRDFVSGESVLGRYAAARVDERLDALEKRISALEETR